LVLNLNIKYLIILKFLYIIFRKSSKQINSVNFFDIFSKNLYIKVTMSTIKSSRYVGPIKILVEDWDRRLTLFSKTLEEWIVSQKRWLYLKQIFSAPDIQRQLTSEAKIFNQVNIKDRKKNYSFIQIFNIIYRLKNFGKI